MNIVDYIIVFIIIVLLVFAIRYSFKHKNQCCGNCSNCSACNSCKRKDKK